MAGLAVQDIFRRARIPVYGEATDATYAVASLVLLRRGNARGHQAIGQQTEIHVFVCLYRRSRNGLALA